MKIRSLIAILAAATLLPASALTADDIAPASLPGKSFIFTIEANFGSPVRSGVWKGTFGEAPGTDFTITNVSGNMVNRLTSYAATSGGTTPPSTSITLPKVFIGTGDFISLVLVVTGNNGTFSMSTYTQSAGGLTESTQTGTFALEGATTAPEISVKLGTVSLTDDISTKIPIGTAKVGKNIAKIFTITNSGDADLTGISVTKDGTNKADFIVGKLGAKTLTGKTSTTFKVTFKPGSKGTKNAAIHIKSNDKEENPFDIKLTGIATK